MGTTTRRRRPVVAGESSISDGPWREPLGESPSEPTEMLIKEARRRQRRRWALSLSGAAVVAGLIAGLMAALPPSGPTHRVARPAEGPSIALPTAAPFPPIRAPRTFVAARPLSASMSGPSALTVDDAATGSVEHVLMPTIWHGMGVNATAVDRAGRVWVTLAHGPTCTGHSFTCRPVPGSCAGEVLRLDPKTGDTRVIVKASGDEAIEDAQPSPNGRYLAYLDAVCTRPGRGQYLRVRDLVTGRSWTIGKGLPACHALGSIAWSPNGIDLAVYYGPGRTPGAGTAGDCDTPRPNELAVVPALHAAAGLPGRRVSMDPNCQADAVTATRSGYAVVEACGRTLGYRTGPASLLLFNRALRVTSRASIGGCLGPIADLDASPGGSDLLVATHQSCNPMTIPLPPVTPPRSTVLFTDTGRGPKTVFDAVTGYVQQYYYVSW